MKDNLGIATLKIRDLYRDKSLTEKEFKKKTKQILEEFRDKELQTSRDYIAKLESYTNDLRTIKRILSRIRKDI